MFFLEHQGADLLNDAIALRVRCGEPASAEVLGYLLEASKHRQIAFAKKRNGEPLAVIAFARISRYTLALLANNPGYKLKQYEFYEGKILYIVDGVFVKNSIRSSLLIFRDVFKNYRLVCFVRNGRLRVYYKNGSRIRSVSMAHTREPA